MAAVSTTLLLALPAAQAGGSGADLDFLTLASTEATGAESRVSGGSQAVRQAKANRGYKLPLSAPLFTSSADGRAQAFAGRVSAPEHCTAARRAIRFYTKREREWRAKMGAGPNHSLGADRADAARGRRSGRVLCPQLHRLALRAQARARAARRAFEVWFRRTYEKWRCIHEREGAWNASTGNGYYGGLQMTLWFQRTYGPEFVRRYGTADRWPVYAQLVAAERAWRECRCFRQWGTAGACGLR